MIEHQSTVSSSLHFSGVGLHTGTMASVVVHPAPVDHGIVFKSNGVLIPAMYTQVCDTKLCTVVAHKGVKVMTIEHLMAAFCGVGLDNALVEIDGLEVPIMDGSSSVFHTLLMGVGLRHQGKQAQVQSIDQPIKLGDDDAFIICEPGSGMHIQYTLTYNHPLLRSSARASYQHSMEAFSLLARARTFGFANDLIALKSNGLAKGASSSNAVGYDHQGLMSGCVLRSPNESAQHKILDFLGDMMLLGRRWQGRITAMASGHTMNQQLVSQVSDLVCI